MVATNNFKAVSKTVFKPSTAWLFVFFPALFYFMGTRLYSLGLFRSSTYGEILGHELIWMTASASLVSPSTSDTMCSKFLTSNKSSKQKLLYMQSNKDCSALRYPIYLVQDFDDGSVVSTTWMEDEELGRGYLLLSTSAGSGKIFRWEAGGGPIAIGRTLHLQDSGCRSNHYQQCSVDGNTGSGGITVDNFRSDALPVLLVAEYGEGRVVRLDENGARTPLIIETHAAAEENRRLSRPFRLLVTPYGDLMVIDDATTRDEGFVLWRLSKASDVPALPSLSVSRDAHAWKRNNSTGIPEVFFQSTSMGGMVVDPSGQGIYVTTMDPDTSSVLVVSLPLLEDLDDNEIVNESEEEGEHDKTQIDSGSKEGKEAASRVLQTRQSKLVFDYTSYAKAPGAIEIDNNGNLYLASENGILVVSESKSFIAKIAFSNDEKIVDLTVGSDNFLYIAMESKLARIRVPNYPLEVKKDLLIKA
mmetsp:Transcript_20590/g.51214  ORF Transcript_20590/g.51214 Transcript_20590/m.51214 type:complete len:473 (-) Transcript_20590:1802-3220(-)